VDALYVLSPFTFGATALVGAAIANARKGLGPEHTARQHRAQLQLFAVMLAVVVTGFFWIVSTVVADRKDAAAEQLNMAGALLTVAGCIGFWILAVFALFKRLAHRGRYQESGVRHQYEPA
jgi:hypothetical protein